MNSDKSVNILGVKIDNLTKQEISERISGFLNDGNFHQVATANPEFILKAQRDDEFKNILNQCDLSVADGFGIKCAFWRFGKHLKARITGIDLAQEILKVASEKNLKIFLAANSGGLSSWEETAKSIKKTYPDLEINGVNLDYEECHFGLNQESREILNGTDIVFCNFGAPYQEKFLNSLKNGTPPHLYEKFSNNSFCNNASNLQNQRCGGKIGLAVGVGGSFDFITGKIKRAPASMRKIGLEWLWRLIQQPRRIKRIFNTVIIFPIRVLFNR